jgi:hypothetical protein
MLKELHQPITPIPKTLSVPSCFWTDNGFKIMTETVPVSLERYNYHMDLLNNSSLKIPWSNPTHFLILLKFIQRMLTWERFWHIRSNWDRSKKKHKDEGKLAQKCEQELVE